MKKLAMIAMGLTMSFAISATTLSAKCGGGDSKAEAKTCCKKGGKACCKKGDAAKCQGKSEAAKKDDSKKSN